MSNKFTICGLLLITFALDSFAQGTTGIAEAARKERERQKRVHSETKVVGAGAPVTTSAGTASTAATASTSVATTTPKQERDEKYWRAQFQKAREDVKRADERIQLLELKLKELNTQMLNRSDVYNREYRLGAEITETQKQLDDARKAADAAKKKITDLEDELRRAGGPPGWAR
jgi:predicted RNase H-like nuclease (RuvC/YqgF family)